VARTSGRGTSNGNSNGNSTDRARRKVWLIETYRADCDAQFTATSLVYGVDFGEGIPACRCYRCGTLLTFETVTVDRIIPGCKGGTYRRENIRPACAKCNSETGGAVRRASKHRCKDCQREDPDDTRRPRKVIDWSGAERCATHIRNPYRGR
jgi:HNH endonuclease